MRRRFVLLSLFLLAGCRADDPLQLINEASLLRDTDPAKAAEVFDRAITMLDRQAQNGDAFAKRQLGAMMAVPLMRKALWPEGAQHRPDSLEGVRLLEEAAREGEPVGWTYLSMLYGKQGRDAEAFALLYRAAEGGDPSSQTAVAERLAMGIGTNPDRTRAIRWYRQALLSQSQQARWEAGRSLRAAVHAGFIAETEVEDELAIAAYTSMP